jgi:hypothetical protein
LVEIAFIFFVIPSRMSRLARERRRSPLLWSVAGSGAFIGTELAVGLLVVTAMLFARTTLGWEGDLGILVFVVYLGPLFSGMFAFEQVKGKLEGLPSLEESDDEIGPISPS